MRAAFAVSAVLLASAAPVAAPLAPVAAAPATAAETESPLALTASDGSGLKLLKLSARAVLDGPLAFTEMALTFQNPRDRVLEGTFRITLPAGAAVSRFAMKMDDGRWQEGEVVEKNFAQRIYEDFLHRRQDPALLEQAGGNEFSARVFPIPANGVKELVVSWSHELERSDEVYELPLAGLPELGTLDVVVQRPGEAVSELHKTRYVPPTDFRVGQSVAKPRTALRAGDLAVMRVTADEGGAADPVRSAVILVDTSASRALGFDAQVETARDLVAALGSATVTIAAFDQSVEVLHDGAANGAEAAGTWKKLRARRALGASNVEAALRWVAGRSGRERVILVTDGVATAGATEADALIAAALALRKAGVHRIDAVAVGGIQDGDRLARLVTAGLARDGVVADGTLPAKEIAGKLARATKSGVAVDVKGAAWSWPKKLDGVQPGDQVLVYAVLGKTKETVVSVGGRKTRFTVESFAEGDTSLVERAHARAHIAALTEDLDKKADGPEQKRKIREEIVGLSTRHRVLSPYTALLVLETEEDYERYGLDRKALADVLTVGPNGVERLRRADAVLAKVEEIEAAESAIEEVATPDKSRMKSLEKKVAGDDDDDLAGGASFGVGDESADFDGSADAPMGSPLPDLALEGEASSAGFASGSGSGQGQHSLRISAAPAPVVLEAPAPKPDAGEPSAESLVMPAEPRPIAAGTPSGPRPGAGVSRVNDEWQNEGVPPYEGTFAEVMELIEKKKTTQAVSKARGWREEAPGDVMALVAYGTALEAAGDKALAARAYGSIIDLFPARADMRRFAGERLEHIGGPEALALAADTFEKAVEQRPDHPASHRLLAFARAKQGEHEKAFAALEGALKREYPSGRFDGVDRILREDLGLLGAAWAKAEPKKAAAIARRLEEAGGVAETEPSLRFVLNWETDANDVDFHIIDATGGHAYYSSRLLESGGELYADVTDGYGPECFTIRTPPGKRAAPYKLKAHYYSRGPMGYGMGKLQVITHDGKGTLSFEERPFVVMVDSAYVDLGEVKK